MNEESSLLLPSEGSLKGFCVLVEVYLGEKNKRFNGGGGVNVLISSVLVQSLAEKDKYERNSLSFLFLVVCIDALSVSSGPVLVPKSVDVQVSGSWIRTRDLRPPSAELYVLRKREREKGN